LHSVLIAVRRHGSPIQVHPISRARLRVECRESRRPDRPPRGRLRIANAISSSVASTFAWRIIDSASSTDRSAGRGMYTHVASSRPAANRSAA
jgi:hypothetical protein